MKLGIAEILDKVSKAETKEEKIDILRRNDSITIKSVLKAALDPAVVWALPKGDPPYTPSPYLDQQNMLYSETRKLYLFIEGGNPNLTRLKRESLFIIFLESLAPEDAKLMCAVKDKKIPFKGITTKLVNEAYPGLINEQVKTA